MPSKSKPFQEVNLKSAIMAMVERLNEGVKRLELASDISASGLGGNGVDEMKMELANVAQVGMEKCLKLLTRIERYDDMEIQEVI